MNKNKIIITDKIDKKPNRMKTAINEITDNSIQTTDNYLTQFWFLINFCRILIESIVRPKFTKP